MGVNGVREGVKCCEGCEGVRRGVKVCAGGVKGSWASSEMRRTCGWVCREGWRDGRGV